MPILRFLADFSEPPFNTDSSPRLPSPPYTSFDRLAITYNMSEGQHDPTETLTPEEASRIIHSHRKVRYGKFGPVLSSLSPITPLQTTQLEAIANRLKELHVGLVDNEK